MSGKGERAMQAVIQRDLSVIAEIYANPPREYIAFSQFPVDHGSVDCALFTSRSRMNVFLIELKGANFQFSNADATFAADINAAAQQLDLRFGDIRRNYERFRRWTHEVRLSVLGGQQRYNSLVGPDRLSQVHDNKEIDVYGVVIGGRTRDDIVESRLKHDREWSSTHRIMFESWDSWLRKLTRA